MAWKKGPLGSYVAELLEARLKLSANVLTWHNDQARTGLNSGESQLTPDNVNGASLGKLFSYPVDAFTNDAAGVYSHRMYALDLTTGADASVCMACTKSDLPGM